MIKLTTVRPAGNHLVIRVEGDLRGDGVVQLEALCAPETPSVLDLRGLLSTSRSGRALLIRLRESGWRIEGASLYVDSLLQESER